MQRFLLAILVFASLGLAGASTHAIIRSAPALNIKLRTESILGDWRVPISRALYDQGEYYFQIGYGYLQGDSLAFLLGAEDLPDEKIYRQRVRLAEAFLEKSLTTGPGRADAWTALAWAELFTGRTDRAMEALRISWLLAPINLGESPDRLALVDALDRLSPQDWRNDPAAIQAVSQDLEILYKYDRRYFQGVMDGSPKLRQVAETADLIVQ